MRLDAFISAGDTFYNGTSGWRHMGPPHSAESMRGGLDAIARHVGLEPAPVEEVLIEGITFQRTVYSNAAHDNAIALYVDTDRTHGHEWLFHQEAFLKATSRLTDAFPFTCNSGFVSVHGDETTLPSESSL